jgi:hypothetical protein
MAVANREAALFPAETSFVTEFIWARKETVLYSRTYGTTARSVAQRPRAETDSRRDNTTKARRVCINAFQRR